MIDTAHLLPFSKFKNDDVRNGIALCKIHHWRFDKGLMSVDSHYRVIVSRSIERERPENIISRLHKTEIIMPQESVKCPSLVALDWHRENVFN